MKFKYVQIGSKDYKRLASFYTNVLNFKEAKNNEWLNTNEGILLEAPGFNDDPLYLGIIKATEGDNAKINDKGYAHICFETTDVKRMVKRLKQYGGSFQSTLKCPTINPCVYCKDIDGNVVEFHIPFPSVDAKTSLTVSSLLGLKKDKDLKTLKFIHVNMITDKWEDLTSFYEKTFDTTSFGKLKDHSGSYKEKVIGIKGVHVVGHHVLVPGYYNSYPTFEVFNYSIKGKDEPRSEKEIGINAIGFTSKDLENDINKIINAGGKLIEKTKDYVLMSDIQGSRIYLR